MVALACLLAASLVQRLSPGQMKEDLAQIETLLDEVHPNPYFHLSRESYELGAKSIVERYATGATVTEFYREAATLVAQFGDGHTRVTPSTPEYLEFRNNGGLLLPLEFSLRDGKVTVSKNYGEIGPAIGTEIKSINGTPSRNIIDQFVPLQSGERLAFREEEAGQSARGFGFILFGWRPPYEVIDLKGTTYRLPGVTIETIRADKPATTLASSGSNPLPGCTFKVISPKIGYLQFESGYAPSAFKSWVESAFKSFKDAGVQALIIDVRNNLGGGQEAGAMVIELFSDKPYSQFGAEEVKVSQMLKDKYGEKEFSMRFGTNAWASKSGSIVRNSVDLTPPETNPLRLKVPTFVLTGPLTFSNGMAFASAVKDCHLGTIIGEETGGLGSGFGQFESFSLNHSKLTFWVSVKHIFRPSGIDDGRGILPDIAVSPTAEDRRLGRDPVLDRAVSEASKRANESGSRLRVK